MKSAAPKEPRFLPSSAFSSLVGSPRLQSSTSIPCTIVLLQSRLFLPPKTHSCDGSSSKTIAAYPSIQQPCVTSLGGSFLLLFVALYLVTDLHSIRSPGSSRRIGWET